MLNRFKLDALVHMFCFQGDKVQLISRHMHFTYRLVFGVLSLYSVICQTLEAYHATEWNLSRALFGQGLIWGSWCKLTSHVECVKTTYFECSYGSIWRHVCPSQHVGCESAGSCVWTQSSRDQKNHLLLRDSHCQFSICIRTFDTCLKPCWHVDACWFTYVHDTVDDINILVYHGSIVHLMYM